MKVLFDKYPIDIIICMLWSTILLPVTLLNVEGTIRIILGLPFILFIPGYILIFALFPGRKTDQGIDIIERIALSLGLSIAIVPIIGLGLNYTEWGIRLEPILLSVFIFIISVGTIALYRWYNTPSDKRFIVSLDISLPKSENKLDRALTIILAIVIIIAMVSLVYVIATPKTGEKFTEFYLLGPGNIADKYPRNLTIGENASVIIGIVNHEYKRVNYTVEIWLINQSMHYNETEDENLTVYHNMWFLDSLNISLPHRELDIEKEWTPQWEYIYTFNVSRNGSFKLAFLLFTEPTEKYKHDEDYQDIAEQKINSAYRELHLWIDIN
jgi:uncharacterized membrane protein